MRQADRGESAGDCGKLQGGPVTQACLQSRSYPSASQKGEAFKGSCYNNAYDFVWRHLYFVSRDFPTAVFLVDYSSNVGGRGKVVFHAGDEIRSSFDSNHPHDLLEWVVPNIFAPFETEYELGLEFESLWNKWMVGMRRQLARLTRRYSAKASRRTKKKGRSKPAPPEGRSNLCRRVKIISGCRAALVKSRFACFSLY